MMPATPLEYLAGWTRAQIGAMVRQAAEFLPQPLRASPHMTRRATVVIDRARHEAEYAGTPQIGAEHLLLGLIGNGGDEVRRALRTQGVDIRAVRRSMEARVKLRDFLPTKGMRFTAEAARAIALSARYAQVVGAVPVDSTHLLLGLLAGDDNVAAALLRRSGASLECTQHLLGAGPKDVGLGAP